MTCSKLKAQAYLTRHDAQTFVGLLPWIGLLFLELLSVVQTRSQAKKRLIDFGITEQSPREKRLLRAKCERDGCIQVGKMTLEEKLEQRFRWSVQSNKASNLHLKQTPSVSVSVKVWGECRG